MFGIGYQSRGRHIADSAVLRHSSRQRWLALLAVLAMLMSLMIIYAEPAQAHHPEIEAHQICVDNVVKISYESVSWKTDGTSGSGHGDIRIEVRVNGSGSWTEVDSGEYTDANNYRFSDTFDGAAYLGKSIEVRARAVGVWDNGSSGGQTRTTPPFEIPTDCIGGNPSCDDFGLVGVKSDPPAEETLNFPGGSVTIDDIYGGNKYFDWSSTAPILIVLVKAGNASNVWDYRPGGSLGDTGLHGQGNQNQVGDYHGLSHIEFCYGEPEPEPGRIIVEKQVTEGSDTSKSFVFSASYDGDGFSLADGESDDSGELAAGTYSVSETVPDGWSLESVTCDDQSDPSEISLQEGETVTCTFVNDELPPEPGRIIVEKEVLLGDQTQAFTFVTTGFDLADNTLAHGESSSSGNLAAGSYAVSETLPSDDWSQDNAVCDNGDDPSDITLDEGEVVTCTFTNSQAEVQASVLVTVDGSCTTNDDGSGTGAVTVVVSVDGGATVVIKSGANTIATFTEDGSVEVPIGQTYTWEATPSDGFEFPPGFVSSGTVDVTDCTEVLPFTGIDTERLLGLSVLLLGAGVMLVVASRGRGKGRHIQG